MLSHWSFINGICLPEKKSFREITFPPSLHSELLNYISEDCHSCQGEGPSKAQMDKGFTETRGWPRKSPNSSLLREKLWGVCSFTFSAWKAALQHRVWGRQVPVGGVLNMGWWASAWESKPLLCVRWKVLTVQEGWDGRGEERITWKGKS